MGADYVVLDEATIAGADLPIDAELLWSNSAYTLLQVRAVQAAAIP